jgi:FKBP-type peptidyl-prolyl cis-trans isomerase FklB
MKLQVAFFFLTFGLSSAGTNEVGIKYLEDMKGKPGVVTLPSGLMYKVLREGTGEDHPTVDSPCECYYAGTTPSLTPTAHEVADDTEALNKGWDDFDSGYKRGSTTTFAPNQVIKGWTEAMQLMVEGDKWEMYIPSDLGYGDGGQGGKIKGGDVLVFRMEIVTIKGNKKPADRCDIATMKGCNDKQVKYLGKQTAGPSEKRAAELKRLEGMAGGEMKDEARAWLMSRIKLLKKMVAKDEL